MRIALAWFAAILLLTGCSSGDTLNLTFDGERCTYEGPTELAAGSVDLVFVNVDRTDSVVASSSSTGS